MHRIHLASRLRLGSDMHDHAVFSHPLRHHPNVVVWACSPLLGCVLDLLEPCGEGAQSRPPWSSTTLCVGESCLSKHDSHDHLQDLYSMIFRPPRGFDNREPSSPLEQSQDHTSISPRAWLVSSVDHLSGHRAATLLALLSSARREV